MNNEQGGRRHFPDKVFIRGLLLQRKKGEGKEAWEDGGDGSVASYLLRTLRRRWSDGS